MRITATDLQDGPCPDARWQVWYQDTFDRECPRQIDIAGQGLAKGLAELWTRHLREALLADGQPGFARFNLWWEQERLSIEVTGDRAGLIRLREWISGSAHRSQPAPAPGLDRALLHIVATTHAYLSLAGRSSEEILSAARDAADLDDFTQRLATLADQAPGSVP